MAMVEVKDFEAIVMLQTALTVKDCVDKLIEDPEGYPFVSIGTDNLYETYEIEHNRLVAKTFVNGKLADIRLVDWLEVKFDGERAFIEEVRQDSQRRYVVRVSQGATFDLFA